MARGRTESEAAGYAPKDDEFDPTIDDFVAKSRKYVHFDLPLSPTELGREPTDDEIRRHSFWPLLGFTIEERRLKHDKLGNKIFEKKPREIKFGSHKDAALLEWYTRSLSLEYERFLAATNYGASVLAYRKGVGDNVTQARDLIAEIRGQGSCTAVAMDIKGFFDNIQHDVLLKAIKKVLDTDRLQDHHYKIFERMTKFEWVDSGALIKRLGKSYGRHGRICTSDEFRSTVRRRGDSLVQVNDKQPFGIPQGTPLSGLFANIAMIEFDRVMAKYAAKKGGSYRRYSDDLAFVVPIDSDERLLIAHAKRQLKRFGLVANDRKTEISKFSLASGVLSADRPFQYLGFVFDGKRTLIRQSSLTRYYRKMSGGVRAKIRAAKEKKIPKNGIFMRELFRKYTHFGRTRNFPRYAYRASTVLGAPEIRHQLKGHMRKFKRTVRFHISKVYR